MYHAIHILFCAFACLSLLDSGDAADKPIPGKDFLPLSTNIEGVLSPSLLKELQERRPEAATITPLTTTRPKALKTTTKSSSRKFRTSTELTTNIKSSDKSKNRQEYQGADLARAQQVQQENQYPFDFRNNFNNFQGVNSQGLGRQFDGGFNGFNQRGPFNLNLQSRQFGSLNDGTRTNENTIQGSYRQNGDNRIPFGNQGGSPYDYDRFQDFGGFGYDDRFSGRIFDSSFRGQGDRFGGYSNFPQQNGQFNNPNNYRQDFRSNFPINSQQGSLRNEQGLNNYQGFPGGFPFQGYAPNSFDSLGPQRFQGQYADDFGRGQQRGNNLFYPSRPINNGPSNGVNGNPSQDSGADNLDGSTSGPLSSASKKSETLQKQAEDKKSESSSNDVRHAGSPDPRLFYYPQLADYSDVSFRPDDFNQYIVLPESHGTARNNDNIIG